MPVYDKELEFLEDIRARPEGCEVVLSDWNEAVSLKARLDKAIRATNTTWAQIRPLDPSPFEGLRIQVVRPNILKFTWGEKLPMLPPRTN